MSSSSKVDHKRISRLLHFTNSYLPGDAADKYSHHLSQIQRHNSQLNLVADCNAKTLLHRHLLDSIIGLRVLDLLASGLNGSLSVVEVGSGGGFPGLVLAVARPHWSFRLIDSAGKKVGFLLKAMQKMKIENTKIVKSRAENLRAAESYHDMCVARAVAPVNQLLKITCHLVNVGGFFVWWKGRGVNKEIREAHESLQKFGVKVIGRYPYRLPHDDINRSLMVAQKLKRY